MLFAPTAIMAAGASVTYATWDPGNVASGLTLSGGNLVATSPAGSTYYRGRGTIALSGKQYWEVTVSSLSIAEIGLCNSSFVIATNAYLGSDGNGYGWDNAGGFYLSVASVYAASSYATGTVLGFAFDSATGKIWIRKAGTWENAGDPAAGTGNVATAAAGTWYPAFSLRGGSVATANFGATAFSGSVPSGFNSGVY